MLFRTIISVFLALYTGLFLNCQNKNKQASSGGVWHLLKNGCDKSYRNDKKQNLLHLAVLSEDGKLIRHVDSLFPELRKQSDSVGYFPVHTAAESCSLKTVKLLDSLGFDFNIEVNDPSSHYDYCVTNNIQTIVQKRLKKELLRKLDNSGSVDSDAEDVYVLIIQRLGKKAMEKMPGDHFMLQNARRFLAHGFKKAADAEISLYRYYPDKIRNLLSSKYNFDSLDVLLLSKMTLPVDQELGRFFFTILKLNQPLVTKAFIEQGAVVNHMSVHNKEVRSALWIIKNSEFAENAKLLKNAGATDKYWFELLIPGFWPVIGSQYDPSTQWHTIIANGDSISVETGKLKMAYFTVQRKEYWTLAKRRALFMIATNKAGGINTCETVISRPVEITPAKPIHLKLKSGNVYDLSTPDTNGTVLRVSSNNRSQDLLQFYYIIEHQDYASKIDNSVLIAWAGDIDSDGKLDILLAGQTKDNMTFNNTFYLALSSLAKNDQLFGWADEVSVYGSYQEFADDNYARQKKPKEFFPYIKQ